MPSLAQIPIFISLYRALLALAAENKLDEPFLWIPNLEGPTYGAAASSGLDWILKWTDGAPKLGWYDTACFLALPVLLVVSQKISTKVLQPPDSDTNQNGFSKALLDFIPFMVGWFSLGVPSGLSIYWLTNNVVTTTITYFVRQKLSAEMASPSGGSGASGSSTVERSPPTTSFSPKGFGETRKIETIPETAVSIEKEDEGEEGEVEDVGSEEPEDLEAKAFKGIENMVNEGKAKKKKNKTKRKRRK